MPMKKCSKSIQKILKLRSHCEYNMFLDGQLRENSNWSPVITAIAVIKRCLQRKVGPISLDDRNEAELTVLKLLQIESFVKEIQMLKHGSLGKGNRLYKLYPFLDDNGVLRVGGRLQRSSLTFEVQHPIILPRSDILYSC